MTKRFLICFSSILCALLVLASGQVAFAGPGGLLKGRPSKLKVRYDKLLPKESRTPTLRKLQVEHAVTSVLQEEVLVRTLPVQKKTPTESTTTLEMPSAQVTKTPEFKLPVFSENMDIAAGGLDVEIAEGNTNLTGFDTLQRYFSDWRQNLGGMFSEELLDKVEHALRLTDEAMFVYDENGELQILNPEAWDYEAQFVSILQNSDVHFTEQKIRQLLGEKGSQQLNLFHYFTLQNTLTFIMAKGKLPRTEIPEKGKRYCVKQLEQRVSAGDVGAIKLLEEVKLRRRIGRSLYKCPEDTAIWKKLNAVVEVQKYLNQTHSPEEWLAIVEKFVETNKCWPCAADPIQKLIYMGADRVMRRHGNTQAGKRLKELKEQYGPKKEPYRTSAQWLEIMKNFLDAQPENEKHWPSLNNPEERALFFAVNSIMYRHPKDKACQELQKLKDQYVKEKAPRRNPQQWWELIKPWVDENKRWPSYFISEEEKQMYFGANNAMYAHPDDPFSIKLKELRAEYNK